ncbi:hypothetical protein T12_13764, partial [Trichinella patagoniensis]
LDFFEHVNGWLKCSEVVTITAKRVAKPDGILEVIHIQH